MRFFEPKYRTLKRGVTEVYPAFNNKNVDDIMTRGRDFYAVWNEDTGLWSQNESDVVDIVDKELWKLSEELKNGTDDKIVVLSMADFTTRSWKMYRDYIRNLPTIYHQLDEKITFADEKVTKKDYISKRLPYSIKEGDHSAWDEMIGTLYSKDEKQKIEWAIGSIVCGDNRKIQKFLVFYGAPGTGKGTVMKIVGDLFRGYCATFNAKALTSNNNAFALEDFRNNPLIGIQQDGDLSRIEDNTQLNSIVSHEEMTINEKYKASYTAKVNCFLFLGSNKPVKITDAKSGIIRRLIDVNPASAKTNPIPADHYESLMDRIAFEYPAIAKHCLDIYKKLGRHYYDGYRPTEMQYKTDMFFNFVEDGYLIFKNQDSTSLKAAYAMYKSYCEDSGAEYRLPMYKFREELKNYFNKFEDVGRDSDGRQVRSWYSGFLANRFRVSDEHSDEASGRDKRGSGDLDTEHQDVPLWLVLEEQESPFDLEMADVPAQYANDDGTPITKWKNVRTKLKEIDSRKRHYILAGKQLVTVDFDLKNENGEKDIRLNLEAARKWPPTYAELSQGGQGLHLEYWYDGDTGKLEGIFSKGIEIKVQSPNSTIDGFPLRRRLSKCNNLPVAHISSGLPLKEDKVVNFEGVKNDKQLRKGIAACLNKEHHGATKPEVDFIFKMLDDAYKAGIPYDVTDLRPAITNFAQNSSHNADYCLKRVLKMKWKSDDSEERIDIHVEAPDDEEILTFFDCEVFPNLFLVNWKDMGEDKPVHRMINPSSDDIKVLVRTKKLVGFNCRRYDNHILYARMLDYTNEQLYILSQRIIGKSENAFFREAYNLSYTDVLDFSSKKQSLKKFEYELAQKWANEHPGEEEKNPYRHVELEFKWDEPVPEEKWEVVAAYCDNDVIATEGTFYYRKEDWITRKTLSKIVGVSVNTPTNTISAKMIFGNDRNPQKQFNWREMGNVEEISEEATVDILEKYGLAGQVDPEWTNFRADGKPIFPGYIFDHGKSLYRGEEVGEGGYVYAEPGIWHDIPVQDVASMHPSSIEAEELFGPEYTKRFSELKAARIAAKHFDREALKNLLGGELSSYVTSEEEGKILAQALKIVINAIYGMTAAKFDNPFRDLRNKDNIVAKRGALFMVNLKHEVQRRGFTVVHIKTDSIKVANPTDDLISFIRAYGKMYGYTFETEHVYDKLCLVNDAVYIAKFKDPEIDKKTGKEIWWDATGAQFQQPYIYKTLFSHEPITFDDMCETKSVTSGALYLDTSCDHPLKKDDPEPEHIYHFIGRAGRFTPIKPYHGGATLVREKDGKYYAVTGTKGYFWLESELIRGTATQDDIDRSYYDRMVEEAVRDIGQYGDFEEFVK